MGENPQHQWSQRRRKLILSSTLTFEWRRDSFHFFFQVRIKVFVVVSADKSHVPACRLRAFVAVSHIVLPSREFSSHLLRLPRRNNTSIAILPISKTPSSVRVYRLQVAAKCVHCKVSSRITACMVIGSHLVVVKSNKWQSITFKERALLSQL